MKELVFRIFLEHYRPKTSYETEKVEYNEINIFAEFQLYNLLFCRNELQLNCTKTAVILNLFWQLLEFNADARAQNQEEYTESQLANTLTTNNQ